MGISVCNNRFRIKIMSTSKSWGFRAYIDQKPEETFPFDVTLFTQWDGPVSLSLLSVCSGCWHQLFQWFPWVTLHSKTSYQQYCCFAVYSYIIFGVWLAQNAQISLMRLIFSLFWVIISSFILSNLSLISISFWLVCMFKRESVEPKIIGSDVIIYAEETGVISETDIKLKHPPSR